MGRPAGWRGYVSTAQAALDCRDTRGSPETEVEVSGDINPPNFFALPLSVGQSLRQHMPAWSGC